MSIDLGDTPATQPTPEASRHDLTRTGKAQRQRVKRSALREVDFAGRPDPIALLEGQATSRVPNLVPIRHGRMAQSQFAFFRGAALVMADDLARSPSSELRVQLCGDAHLSNFGVYATPERRLIFDVNDFDETYPGPFEWDVKRLSASLAVAARDRGFPTEQCRPIARGAATAYRIRMGELAGLGHLDVWYAHMDADTVLKEFRSRIDAETVGRAKGAVRKARQRTSMQALGKLTRVVDGRRRIVSDPPLIIRMTDLLEGPEFDRMYGLLLERFANYKETLQWDRRVLLERYRMIDFALKVVGVGSVGTRCWIALFEGADGEDPLFLQVKEAEKSVLARYVTGPDITHQGERVVNGQRLMQEASDIFLGWDRGEGLDGAVRDFYVRQLRDGKLSAQVDTFSPELLELYGRLCGRTLAQAHARSGDRFAIAGYLGSGGVFDDAMAEFALAYAEQNTADHAALRAAIDSGRVQARLDL